MEKFIKRIALVGAIFIIVGVALYAWFPPQSTHVILVGVTLSVVYLFRPRR